jgi:hypothetical protein
MKTPFALAPLLAGAALLSCGPGSQPPPKVDAGQYFAFKENGCWEYSKTTATANPPAIGIAAEDVNIDGAPKPNYRLRARVSGNRVREVLVSVQGQDLLLASIIVFGAQSESWTFDPPVKIATAPLSPGRLETKTHLQHYVGATVQADVANATFRVDVSSADAIATPLGQKNAFSLLCQGLDETGSAIFVDQLWHVANEGWAQVRFNESSSVTYIVQKSRTVDPAQSQICGTLQ